MTSETSRAAALAVGLAFALLSASACTSGGPGVPASRSSSVSAQSGEGVPDPHGRIAFGRITRIDQDFGQVVSLFAIDPDGSDEVQLTDGESGYPEWSPLGDRLAYTVGLEDGSWQVATMAPDGRDVTVLTSGQGEHGTPSWMPDGSALLYAYSPTVGGGEYRTTLWRMNADGTDQKRIGNPDTFDLEPKVSPDGKEVVFSRLTKHGEKFTTAVTVRDLASGRERVLPAAGSWPEHADWSADGRWIVYNVWSGITDSVPNDQVERVAADGSGQATVLFAGTAARAGFKPKISPDGTQIAFGCVLEGGRSSDSGLCLMNSDGTNAHIVVDRNATHENHFDWGPTSP